MRRKHWTSKSASRDDGAVVSHRRTLHGITILAVSVEESLDEDDSTVRFCPVPQAMSMSALSVVLIDCVQYDLQEIRGLH